MYGQLQKLEHTEVKLQLMIITTEWFTKNKPSNVYTAFFILKNPELASELFAMIEIIFPKLAKNVF